MAQKSQMLLKKSIKKTKTFFHKTLQNFKSFLHDGYHPKLPKSFILKKMFHRSNGNRKSPDFDNFWQSTLDEVMSNAILLPKIQNKEIEQEECSGSTSTISLSVNAKNNEPKGGRGREQVERNLENRQEIKPKRGRGAQQVERKLENRQESKRRELSSPSLARKLKQLEMMEPSDVEHVLDIEEALHYYSRLTCPVYADIVDNFCTDMYNEYSFPENSVSTGAERRNGSLKRLGPLKI